MGREHEQIFLQEDIQKANRYIAKECSASLTISEMQVQTTMRSHLAPLGMAIFKIREKDLGEDVEESGPLCVGRGNVTWCGPYGEQQGGSSKNQS